jgi:aryl-alcohol dehydrogenase-like predicted oxidoreductase
LGNWFQKTGNRENVVLASKIAGGGDYTKHIRTGGFTKAKYYKAVEGSLQRLQTDYLDLYQLHWPSRGVNCFGVRDYPYQTATKEAENHLEILETLDAFVKAGTIRTIGLSNETPWGTMKYLQTANDHNLPRPVTIQNSYSLIHRGYEVGLSEVSMREDIGLLAYSPLAQGVLSGKYLDGKSPEGSRGNLFPRFIARYMGDGSSEAVKRYQEIAKNNGITLSELSLAFVNQLPFVTSNIIGATKMSQLKENIGSIHIELSEQTLQEIQEVHAMIPNPAP